MNRQEVGFEIYFTEIREIFIRDISCLLQNSLLWSLTRPGVEDILLENTYSNYEMKG